MWTISFLNIAEKIHIPKSQTKLQRGISDLLETVLCSFLPTCIMFCLTYLYFVLYFVSVLCSVFCTYIKFYVTYLYYVLFNLPILYVPVLCSVLSTCILFCIMYIYYIPVFCSVLFTRIMFCLPVSSSFWIRARTPAYFSSSSDKNSDSVNIPHTTVQWFIIFNTCTDLMLLIWIVTHVHIWLLRENTDLWSPPWSPGTVPDWHCPVSVETLHRPGPAKSS